MHRKTPVVKLEIYGETPTVLNIIEILNPEHVPLGLNSINGSLNRAELNDWLESRSIPASRQNFQSVMIDLSLLASEPVSANRLIMKCYGLSLSDQYWINPADNPLDWDKINFFDNDFSEDVGDILFNSYEKKGKVNLFSPDNTSDGWLQKRWKIINGDRYLIKGGSPPFYQEPFNEAMAAAVMKRFDISYVPYEVIICDEKPYSVCPNFIKSDTDLISAYYIYNSEKYSDNDSSYQHFLKCCSNLGIPNAEEDLQKMLTVDYLIANRDRHFNNFGAVRNAETLKWSGLSPVFDSGTSFWNDIVAEHLFTRDKIQSKPFEETHDKQIKILSDFSWFDLSSLKGIEDEFRKILSISDIIDEKRINNICNAFNGRVKELSAYIAGKNKTIAISEILSDKKEMLKEILKTAEKENQDAVAAKMKISDLSDSLITENIESKNTGDLGE
jgi:hypothetical protein